MKYAVITGASKGIGYSVAEQFSHAGWQVINLSRNACSLKGVTNIAIDFNETDWQTKHAATLTDYLQDATQISLVHNAAFYTNDSCDNFQETDLRRSLEINVIAVCLLNQIIIPLMPPQSSLIYIGSTLSEKAVAGCASYTISKHALVGLMKASTQDLMQHGIHSACICPGFTDTPMLREHLHHDAALIESLAKNNAAKRLVNPEEIAKTALFCAENPVINGSVIHANLGQVES